MSRHAENLALFRVYQEGGREGAKALRELVERNKPLIFKLARKCLGTSYYNRHRKDYEQSATVGFVVGISRWKPERGSLSACVFYWILNEITKTCAALEYGKKKAYTNFRAIRAYDTARAAGKTPTPESLGIKQADFDRLRTARPSFVEFDSLDTEPEAFDVDDGIAAREVLDRLPPKLRAVVLSVLAGEPPEAMAMNVGTTPEGVRALVAGVFALIRGEYDL